MADIRQIDTSTLRAWLKEGKKIYILDIRPVKERQNSLFPGSIHVDAYDKLKQNDPLAFDGLYLDKTIPVVTLCGSGKASLIAADMLIQKGYSAFSLEGGLNKWNQQQT